MKDLSGVFRKPLFAIVICGMGRKIVSLERLLTRRRRISLLLKNRMVMETSIKTTVFALAGCVMAISGTAQTPKASLSTILSRSVCERVQVPMIFSTRDTAFALSLPSDEPATIYLQLTVGRNGKVKEKQTRVHANHLAGYVSPAFVAAVKGLRVECSELGHLSGRDTSLLLAFPLEYQCVYDTMSKAFPAEELDEFMSLPLSYTLSYPGRRRPITTEERANRMGSRIAAYPSMMKEKYLKTKPTRVWYYLVFLKEQ